MLNEIMQNIIFILGFGLYRLLEFNNGLVPKFYISEL